MKAGDKIDGLKMPDGTVRTGTITSAKTVDLGFAQITTATGVALCPSCEEMVARGDIERPTTARDCGKVSVSGATDRNYQHGYEAIFGNKPHMVN